MTAGMTGWAIDTLEIIRLSSPLNASKCEEPEKYGLSYKNR